MEEERVNSETYREYQGRIQSHVYKHHDDCEKQRRGLLTIGCEGLWVPEAEEGQVFEGECCNPKGHGSSNGDIAQHS